ncbi:MAG: pyridoxamine 5'-phosphate oxidase family protein [Deltaproteobacteria bacterium]|jgi:nitroimidazol reductase NimA-like FMN-containing flavoprotein (pyridoxamine 5'-phosphate oxidase superfamily)|nr:pyridoxamine 5'-phosphate oxidase family protein [Deltaproteobacteria bacterium]MBW2535623.1 pyridoxamine 5'-phosphate oxidase family protein [Deltaproteobacteria bacterium]
MRRVRDEAWMRQLLADEEVGHLGLAADGQPYVVPLNYAYIDDKIVIHCATKGRKVDLVRQAGACCFAVNRHPDRIRYHAEKRCHYRYHSVLAFGRARYVEDGAERLEWLTRFRDYFSERLGRTIPPEIDRETAEKVGIIVIEVDELTGRKEEGADPKADLSEPLDR